MENQIPAADNVLENSKVYDRFSHKLMCACVRVCVCDTERETTCL